MCSSTDSSDISALTWRYLAENNAGIQIKREKLFKPSGHSNGPYEIIALANPSTFCVMASGAVSIRSASLSAKSRDLS